ncbi:Transposase [Corynebacterium cystitidis DSM 20524]|uniref:Transposase n=2 Tax=Corynebacterium cystitidis DSM 20524 TaxID=1121357 RepID=A0A1H9WJL0_9CORY|nr:Transposase [Corynebacterium cystitidis DSM 20524]WJY81377.1 Transposase [Corynebacterium cystitidis DSM 20524]SES34065.1 transposase [Corynebacterium cystitidis DSM 20524]SNV87981.1 transposase IS3513 [Corynebacterium cystitidis]SNV88051.1 transposase IS3513 [Corynebacterium cystitidis]
MILLDVETLTIWKDSFMPRMYSPQFRQQCVDAVLTLGKKRADVVAEYEIAKSTLDRWIAQETGTLGTGSGSHRKAGDPDSDDPQEMAKIIAELRKENEFLKKAAALLAKEIEPKTNSK